MSRYSNCCPFCGKTNYRKRTRKGGYKCASCGQVFQIPATRKIREVVSNPKHLNPRASELQKNITPRSPSFAEMKAAVAEGVRD